MVSVPADSRRGVLTAASIGPTIASQSAMTCAVAGLPLRKAGRTTRGSSAPSGRGP